MPESAPEKSHRVKKVAAAIVGHESIRYAAINLAPHVGKAARAATYAVGARFGTAGTGTPNADLHGAALSNATLAWFGLGPVATGGHGKAGGEKVLAGVGIAGNVASLTVAALSIIAQAYAELEVQSAAAQPAVTADGETPIE